MSGILGYARAYRPMTLSSPAAAEATAGGQATQEFCALE
jgi:hypothetical protein